MRYVMLLVFALGLASCGGDEVGRYQLVRQGTRWFMADTTTGVVFVQRSGGWERYAPAVTASDPTESR